MLSLRFKTYALLSYDGVMMFKGSALRSRRMEPCFRRFLLTRPGDFCWRNGRQCVTIISFLQSASVNAP